MVNAVFGALSNVATGTTVAPGQPGTVLDLAVASTTDTSVTLSFTEVDDGIGAPASYDMRAVVGPTLTWPLTNGSLNSKGTCASPMVGSAVGAKRTCTVVGLVAGAASNFHLGGFRGAPMGEAGFWGLSNAATRLAPG